MSWAEMPEAELWALAERVCTEREVDALRHMAAGFSSRRAAAVLGVSRSTYRDRLDSAARKLNREMEWGEG